MGGRADDSKYLYLMKRYALQAFHETLILKKHTKETLMELRVLRYFLAVAREGSVTGAARFLNVTQPTLSRQIRELEEELGQQLFVRGSHSVSLTAEGMILRKRAEEIVDMVGKTKAEFSAMQETVGGDIHIGGGETEGMKLIADVINGLRRDYPDIHYHLYSGNAEDLSERLDKGLLDFCVLIQPIDLSKYDYIDMPVKDVWGVIMHKDSPLARKEAVERADLLKLPLVCSRQAIRPAAPHNEFLDWFGDDFQKLDIIATYNLLFNAALLAEQGVGYVITLDKLVNPMNAGVCFRPFEPKLEAGLSVVWKRYQVFSPAARIFLDALRRKLAA